MPQGPQRGPGAGCAAYSLQQPAPAAAPSESRLAAALKEAGIEDGRLPGAYKDEGDGHAGRPWRSHFRREGFKLKGGRHPSHADAALRILEAYQAHPAYVATGRFTLAAGKHVDAEQLARLVEAARADAGRCPAPPGAEQLARLVAEQLARSDAALPGEGMAAASAVQCAIRAQHLETNGDMPDTTDGSMAGIARVEGMALVEPPSVGGVPAHHSDQMVAVAAAQPQEVARKRKRLPRHRPGRVAR